MLEHCLKTGQSYDIPVWTVASFNHQIISDHHIVVGNDAQEADLRIMNLAEPGDIVITQDWGLAAMLLGKGVYCLSPSGREYDEQTVEFLLEERELKAKFRRSGGRTKGPRKRQKEDDVQFRQSLERCILKMKIIPK